jgi:hypothetical protein
MVLQWIGNLSERAVKILAASIVAAIFLLPAAAVLWMTAVPGVSHTGKLPPLTADQAVMAARLRAHVEAIASTPHNIEHPEELEQSAAYIEGVLSTLGYKVERQRFRADGQIVRNIEVVIEPHSPHRRDIGDRRALRQRRPGAGRERQWIGHGGRDRVGAAARRPARHGAVPHQAGAVR